MRLLLRTTENSHESTQLLSTLLQDFGSWNDTSQSYSKNGWHIYVIGMEAGTCGWFELMHTIMGGLCKKAETEGCFYWLGSLSSLAHAEWTLSKQRDSETKLTPSSSNLFLKSITQLKALQSLDRPRISQLWFIQLRMEMLANIQQTLFVIDLDRPKEQSRLMMNCANQFRKMASKYDFISQAQFGVGKQMLETIESYKICALVCEYFARLSSATEQSFFCIDPSLIRLLQDDYSSVSNPNTRNRSRSIIDFLGCCIQRTDEMVDWDMSKNRGEDEQCAVMTNNYVMISYSPLISTFFFFTQTRRSGLKLALEQLMSDPLMLPKSFFEYRKNLSVQLTTEPRISEPNTVKLQPNEDLVIKFEGLVQVDQRVKRKSPEMKTVGWSNSVLSLLKIDLEKKIKKAVIVCFLTHQKVINLDDKINASMLFSEPTSSSHQVSGCLF